MKIVCFGDSNTWGYDPRDFFGGPYDTIWPDILQKKTWCVVCKQGENGREIPTDRVSFPEDTDLLILMLGTNDLLQHGDPEAVCRKMEQFVQRLVTERISILLVAPPHMRFGSWVTDPDMISASASMSEGFRRLAQQSGILFADAQNWNVEIAYDGVHFTENGHQHFAEGMIQYFKKELEICFKME